MHVHKIANIAPETRKFNPNKIYLKPSITLHYTTLHTIPLYYLDEPEQDHEVVEEEVDERKVGHLRDHGVSWCVMVEKKSMNAKSGTYAKTNAMMQQHAALQRRTASRARNQAPDQCNGSSTASRIESVHEAGRGEA